MHPSLLPSLAPDSAMANAVQWAVPSFHDKQPYNRSNVWILAAPYPLILLQIHLLIRYNPTSTWLLRASLVPIVSLLGLRSAFALYYAVEGTGQIDGRGQQVNMTLGCYALAVVFRTFEFGLVWRRPQLKVRKTQSNGHASHIDKAYTHARLPTFFPGTWCPLEIDLLLNIRALGWEHGVKESIPALPIPTHTSHERWAWICKRMAPMPFAFLLYDAICVLVTDRRFYAPAISNVGGSIWDCSQGSFGVAGPYLACLAFASVFVCSLYMVHTTLACLSVGLLNDRPSRWDPAIMTWPWSSTSVAELWAKRWHQYLRGPFMTAGYWPVRFALRPIAGRRVANIAAIWGAFFASGILHEAGRAAMLPPTGRYLTQVTLFFILQPVAIFGEQLFKFYTGRRVRGFWGWLWTMTWMLNTAPLLLEVMSQGGMLVSKNQTLDLTRRPVTAMLDWWDRTFNDM